MHREVQSLLLSLLLLSDGQGALGGSGVLEQARAISSSIRPLPRGNDVAEEPAGGSPAPPQDDRVANAYLDLEDVLFFNKEKRDVARGESSQLVRSHTSSSCAKTPDSRDCCELLMAMAGVEGLLAVFRELDDALPPRETASSWPAGLDRQQVLFL